MSQSGPAKVMGADVSEPKTKDGTGLERLLTDMIRDGWFSGVDAGLDVVMARMDGETGLYNREHFESLVDDAIGDSLHGRERRASDGPEVGNVAVLAVRVRNWEDLAVTMTDAEETATVAQVGAAMRGAFRVDDVIGRISDDVFGLLLRGCPVPMHDTIAERCRVDLADMRVRTAQGWSSLDVAIRTSSFSGAETGATLTGSVERMLAQE